MKRKKIIKSKGILFWITGLSGAGKTSIAKKLLNKIKKKYGPTIIISGDDLRKIFELKKYSFRERLKLSEKYCKLSKFITDQKINLIFATVAMMDKPRKWNRRNIKNYIEIYIKSDVKKIIKEKKKKIYFNKKNTNLVGINVKAEFPKNSDIVINNKFNIPISKISDNLFNKINKLIYY